MSVIERNNVTVRGHGDRAMYFAHGFGCDQNMWRLVTPAFEDKFKIVLFDHVGVGGSDLKAYSREKYSRLDGYAEDLIEICNELALSDTIFVGHSVSSMIGVLAAAKAPRLFGALVLVGPSPAISTMTTTPAASVRRRLKNCSIFSTQPYGLVNGKWRPTSWVMRIDRNGRELTNSFCRTDPEIAKHFARTTFMSDDRDDLAKVSTPSLIYNAAKM